MGIGDWGLGIGFVTEARLQEADGDVDGVVVSVEAPAAATAVKVAGDAHVVYSGYLDAVLQVLHEIVYGGIGLLGIHVVRNYVDHDQAVLGGEGTELIVGDVAVVGEDGLGARVGADDGSGAELNAVPEGAATGVRENHVPGSSGLQ